MKDLSTDYSGLKGYYFNQIINEIIYLIKKNKHKIVLDYGCGKRVLERKISKKYKILNYDINPVFSNYKKINDLKYDAVVINHVLMYLNIKDINKLFKEFYKKNKNLNFIIGIGKQNFLSKILMLLTFNFKAHQDTKSTYKEQMNFLKGKFNIISRKNIFNLTTLIYVKFKVSKNKDLFLKK